MPAPPPESLPAIVSAVRMLITSARLCRIIAPPRPRPCHSSRRPPIAPDRGWPRHGVRAGAVLFAAALTGAAAQVSVTRAVDGGAVHLQPVAVLLAGAVLGARLGALEPGAVPAARRHRRGDVRAVAGAGRRVWPGCSGRPAASCWRSPLAAFAAGLAGRPRLDAHLRRRGGGDGWPAWRCCTPVARRGWRCSAGPRPSLVTLWAFAAADLVKVALAAGGRCRSRCGRSAPAERGRAAVAVRRRGRRSGSTETAGTSRAAAAAGRRASPRLRSSPAATRSLASGPGPESPAPEVHDAEPSARLQRRRQVAEERRRGPRSRGPRHHEHRVERRPLAGADRCRVRAPAARWSDPRAARGG